MHSETSTPSSSTTSHSMINASTTQMKRVGRKSTRHPRRSNGGGERVSEVHVPYAWPIISSVATSSPPVLHAEMAIDGAAVHSGHLLPPPVSSSSSHQDINNGEAPLIELWSMVEALSSSNGGMEFVDEEAVFNMPLLVDSMAEAMLLTPPAMKKGFRWSQVIYDDDDDDLINYITLWNDSWMMD